MQKIEEQRAAMRTRLEAALGVRLGFTMDEAAAIAGISKKGFYNSSIGFKVGGKRRVGVDDLLDLVAPLKGESRAITKPRQPAPSKSRGAPAKAERLEADRRGLTVRELRAQQAIELRDGGAA
ncbi:hypothetical protein [Thiobacillus sp. 0-1251]|uniref:hypothetical protein n=1 Tax=Thiobacillus sp. 0-1251 TaxID=1895858 RepID=UPI0025D68DA7|nr:hypothetical protein [Thiobacillus sp. 0-1251]